MASWQLVLGLSLGLYRGERKGVLPLSILLISNQILLLVRRALSQRVASQKVTPKSAHSALARRMRPLEIKTATAYLLTSINLNYSSVGVGS